MGARARGRVPESACPTDAHVHSHPRAAHGDTHTRSAYLYAAPALSHSDGYAHSHCDSHGDRNAHSHCDSHGDRNAASDANASYRTR